MIKYFRKKWDAFKAKSVWGKSSDLIFLILLIVLFTPGGRVYMQRLILMSGLMGSIEVNMDEELNEESLNWELEDLNGNRVSISELNDKPVFLNFWATWCPPCKAEMPAIESLYAERRKDMHMLLVSYEDPNKVRAFLKEEAWENLPVYFPLSSIPKQLKAEALPTTFIIDSQGKILHRSKGMSDWSSGEVQSFILSL